MMRITMPQLPGRSRARKEILMTRERTLRGVRFHIHINSKRNADPLADFSGRQGLDLYLKCLQLILRHQIWFLVHEKGLPSELETVIFDLWALRITQLGDRIANDSHENESTRSQTTSEGPSPPQKVATRSFMVRQTCMTAWFYATLVSLRCDYQSLLETSMLG
jgi:hypothetical protein